MRRLLVALVAPLAAAAAAGGTVKSLTLTRPATGLATVVVKAGVGEVEVMGDSGQEISVQVELRAKDGGFIFGSHQSERDLEDVRLEPRVAGGDLTLELQPDGHGDRHWSESWTVRIPASLAASVKLGVGDVRVLDVAGDVTVEAGVGDVRVEGEFSSAGDIRATCGVGDASLRTPNGHNEGKGFIGHDLSAHGPGKASIRARAGVGDVTIRLR